MKLKESYILKKIASETVAIYCENNIADLRRAVSLNGSAQIMFKALLGDTSREDLIMLLTKEYNIPETQAAEDVNVFLKLLYDNNMLDG